MKQFYSLKPCTLCFLAISLSLTLSVSFGATITSNGSGTWGTTGNWVGGVIPKPHTWPNDDVIIASGHAITVSNKNFLDGGSLTIESGGSLTISGNTVLRSSSSFITVKTGGTLIITGNITLNDDADFTEQVGASFSVGGLIRLNSGTGNSNFTTRSDYSLTTINATGGIGNFNNYGNLTISGDVDLGTGTNEGTFTVAGDLTINSSSVYTNSGTITLSNATSDFKVVSDGSFSQTCTGILTVGGNFSAEGSVSTSICGTMDVAGNFANQASADFFITGDVTVQGNLDNSGASDIDVDGQLLVMNEINQAGSSGIKGMGIVGWGSWANSGGGPTFLTCEGTTTTFTWPSVPPFDTMDLDACGIALPIKLVEQGFDEHNFWWTAVEEYEIGDYVVMYSNDGESYMEIDRISFATTSSVSTYESNVDGLTGYFYVNIEFNSKPPEKGPISFNGNTRKLDYNLSLNPLTGLLKLYSSDLNNTAIGIVNAMGQYLFSGYSGAERFTFKTNGLSPGVYFLRVKDQSLPFYID